MKNLVLLTFLGLGLSVNAQITLEHTYDSASTNPAGNSLPVASQLMVINLEVSGYNYVNINRSARAICTYDLAHQPVKRISYASLPQAPNNLPTILYISEKLFDTDAMMEYMYIFTDVQYVTHTLIVKENGTILLNELGSPAVYLNVEQQQYPIANTPAGTKLILSYPNGQARVFSLPGTLTTAIGEGNHQLMTAQGYLQNAYPNPTQRSVQIDYTLPQDVYAGQLVFYDLSGKEVKRVEVDQSSGHMSISTADLPSGTYLYQLQAGGESRGVKRLVVISK